MPIVVSTTPEKGREWEKEIDALKDKLAEQATLKEKENQLRREVEEQNQRTEDGLRLLQSNMDRLKEEKETLQQDRDKLWRMVETEIEQLMEEL